MCQGPEMFMLCYSLPYTDAVIREIIRKEPITPLGVARRAREDTMLGGYYIPKVSQNIIAKICFFLLIIFVNLEYSPITH